MSSLVVTKNAIDILDNFNNRITIKNVLIDQFIEKYSLDNRENAILYDKFNRYIDNMTLFELLSFNEERFIQAFWDEHFEKLKKEVCKKVPGAEYFFRIGSQASLNTDKFWNEYNELITRFIPLGAATFIRLEANKQEWDKMITRVCIYIEKIVPTKYKWVAFSNDGAYEVKSKKMFESKKDCYDDMRNAVLEKMKWNTEYDEDFEQQEDAVGYKVRFTQDMIIHVSYSGTYVYKIVGEYDEVKMKDIFTDEFKKWLKNNNLDWA